MASKQITDEQIRRWFTHQNVDSEQERSINALRSYASDFAIAIRNHVQPCADQNSAMRKVREALMLAIAAIESRNL